MRKPNDTAQARLERDLAELKLLEIAKQYREVLDEAARKGSSTLEVLATLIGIEAMSVAASFRATFAASGPVGRPHSVRHKLPQLLVKGLCGEQCATHK